jgi:hypothetical protein
MNFQIIVMNGCAKNGSTRQLLRAIKIAYSTCNNKFALLKCKAKPFMNFQIIVCRPVLTLGGSKTTGIL